MIAVIDLSVAGEALELVIGLWPVTLVLLGLVITVVGRGLTQHGRVFLQNSASASLPFLFSAAIMLCGVLLSNPTGGQGLTVWGSVLIGLLLLFQVILSGILIWRLRGRRVLAVSASLFGAWLSLCFAFVSMMSVSGDWL